MEESLVKCARISYEGDKIATGGNDRTVRVWSINKTGNKYTVNKEHEFKEHEGTVNFVDFGYENHLLCSASSDKTCLIYSLKTEECLQTLTFAEDSNSTNLAFHSCYFSKDE